MRICASRAPAAGSLLGAAPQQPLGQAQQQRAPLDTRSSKAVRSRASGSRAPGAATAAAVDRPVDDKVALITGANTGIGFETAKALLRQDYRVVLGCRDKAKAETARARLQELVPGNTLGVEVACFDLADLASVRAWAQRAQDFGHPLDLLVNNAGVMACPELATKDGFEYQLGVNHLGHFLLTNMLLPLLSDPSRPSRIVTVSSAAHSFGKINFDDLQSAAAYDPWRAYGQSKLANVLFTYQLARRLSPADNCTANTLHPGVVGTELGRYLLPAQPAWWQRPLVALGQKFALTPEQGARTSIYLASSPEVQGVSGKYYDRCRPVSSSPASYDADVAARLWDVSAELVGL